MVRGYQNAECKRWLASFSCGRVKECVALTWKKLDLWDTIG